MAEIQISVLELLVVGGDSNLVFLFAFRIEMHFWKLECTVWFENVSSIQPKTAVGSKLKCERYLVTHVIF